jgi:metallo-beta-lactamase class B
MKFAYRNLLAGILSLALLSSPNSHSAGKSKCEHCAEWNQSQKAFRIYGNSYYVGVQGLSSILVTSEQGHVLIDGALPESAPKIAANIRSLGFKVEDIKLILNSHVHDDHAGGIAELQRLSGATVFASKSSAEVLKSGKPSLDDPQHDIANPLSPVSNVKALVDGQTLNVGTIAITAHFTPGHTPGGTSWTWKSCEKSRCLNIAYVDSLTSVSADGFRFTDSSAYPTAREDFKRSFDTVSSLPCDILVTPHPDFADVFEKLAKREKGDESAFIDEKACGHLADRSRNAFAKRLAKEAETMPSSKPLR